MSFFQTEAVEDVCQVMEVEDANSMFFEVSDESQYPQDYQKRKEENNRFNFETSFIPMTQKYQEVMKNYRDSIYSQDLGITKDLLLGEYSEQLSKTLLQELMQSVQTMITNQANELHEFMSGKD